MAELVAPLLAGMALGVACRALVAATSAVRWVRRKEQEERALAEALSAIASGKGD